MTNKVCNISQNAFRQLLLIHRMCNGEWMLPQIKKSDCSADLFLEARNEWLSLNWIELDFDGEMSPTFELSRILYFLSNIKSSIKIVKNEQSITWLLKGPTDSLQIVESEKKYTIGFISSTQVMNLIFDIVYTAEANELIVQYLVDEKTEQYKVSIANKISIDEMNKILKNYYSGKNNQRTV